MPEQSTGPNFTRIFVYILCAVVPLVLVLLFTNSSRDGRSPDHMAAANSASGSEITPANPVMAQHPPTPAPAPTTAPATRPAVPDVVAAPAHAQPALTSSSGPALDDAMSQAVQSAVSRGSFVCTPVVGGAFAQTPFQDVSADGVLIGFKIGMGKFFENDVVKSFQPIYLTPDGEKFGKRRGGVSPRTLRLTGPSGYAVGAATIRGGGGLDAITLTFMRIKGNHLDTHDCYVSPRMGGNGGGEASFGGDGTPIIGICGRENDENEWTGLGMVFLKSTPTAKAH